MNYPTLRSPEPKKNDILSNTLEPIRAGVPHRLPLPPLLASPLPNSNSVNLNAAVSSQRSALRPSMRRLMLPCIGYTNPLLEISNNNGSVNSRLVSTGTTPGQVTSEYGSSSINLTKSEINSLCRLQGGPRALNTTVISDLKILAASSQRAGKPLAEALCRWNLAVEYESAGKHLEALKSYNSFLQPCMRAGYAPGVVAGLSGMGAQLYILAGFTVVGGNTGEFNTIKNLGLNDDEDSQETDTDDSPLEVKRKRLTSAVAFYEKALASIPDAIKLVDSTTGGWVSKNIAVTSILNNIGLCFIALGDYYAASGAFKKALQYALLVPKRSYERVICANQASVDAYFGNFERAKDGIEHHIAMFCAESDDDTKRKTAFGIGNEECTYSNVLEKQPQTIQTTTDGRSNPTVGSKLVEGNNLGSVDRDICLNDPMITKAPKAQNTASYATEIGAVLANMGALARMHGDVENSKEFYSRAYNLSVRTGDEKHSVVSACALGAVCGEEIAANDTTNAVSLWLDKQKTANGSGNIVTFEGYATAHDDDLDSVIKNI